MNLSKFSPKLLIGILLAIFFFVALSFRVFLPYDQVFSGEWIKFTSIDAYFHMRLVDNLVHNFPHLTSFDPYFVYPALSPVGGVHFFDWLLAGIIWVIGLGSPTQHTIDVIGVYFPVILAALTVIPVYFIGKALFNRWAGVLAAALIAILPGEYLGRSILGFTDHHVAETLFSTVAVLFLILAIKEAELRRLTFGHLIKRDRPVIIKPLIYSLLAGIFLGIYLITWAGGLLFVFIISLYLIIQFIIDHLRRKSTDHLGITGAVLFLVALIIFLPFSPATDYTISMVIALLIPLVLAGISLLVSARGLKPFYYPLTLFGIGIVFMAIFYIIAPGTLGVMLDKFRFVFFPAGATATTTLEMQPFLSPQGSFSTLVAWGNYTTSFFLTPWWPIPGFAIISFIILIYLFTKQRSDEKHLLLFFVWTLVILMATLVQRRFAYYLVVNIALLSAYLSWQAIWLAGLRKLVTKPEPTTGSVQEQSAKTKVKKKRYRESQGLNMNHINLALAIIVVFLFVYFPNIVKSKEVASAARFAPTDAWQASLLWMKENTPEPFGDADAYYQLYQPTPRLGRNWPIAGASTDELMEWMSHLRENVDYPESAYGVLSWWDYGYWITRTAHRIPNANPAQNVASLTLAARFFTSQEESLAQETIQSWDSSYIVIDYMTASSKFWAVVTWSGREQDEFVGVYHLPHEGKLLPIQLFNPEYYRTMLVRLYNFDGKAVTKGSPMVVSYDEKVDRQGNHYRQITDVEEVSSYQEALDYVESQESANCRIVGINPFISPIPLEAVQNYRLVYMTCPPKTIPDIIS